MQATILDSTTSTLPRGADFSLLARDAKNGVNAAGVPSKNNYAGIPLLADSVDVHEVAMELVRAHVPKTARVLDVGAGAGALTQRMIDQGYTRVEAVDVNRAGFQLPDVPLHALDLQGDWARQTMQNDGEAADAVVTLEVIEHLENPWHFARQCAAAVRPGGVIVVSTPNIQSTRSRLQFLFQAEFRFFKPSDFEAVGHMTSLTRNQILQAFGCADCELIDESHSRHKGLPMPKSLKKFVAAVQYAAAYPLMRGNKHGETGMYAFRRTV